MLNSPSLCLLESWPLPTWVELFSTAIQYQPVLSTAIQYQQGLGIQSSVNWSNRSFFVIKRSIRSWKRSSRSCWTFSKIDVIESITVDLFQRLMRANRSCQSFKMIEERRSMGAYRSFGKKGWETVKNIQKICFFRIQVVFLEQFDLLFFFEERQERFDLFEFFERSTRAIRSV